MTPEAQRIAIAEVCGWKREWINEDRRIQQWVCRRPDGQVDYCDPDPDATWETHRLPDYLNSLDAMHEAEKVLTSSQCAAYRDMLEHNTAIFDDMIGACIDWQLVHATASQRAEAFLRTLNLWDNTKLTHYDTTKKPARAKDARTREQK